MGDEKLISKKDLLSRYGISYGALYRWKRKGLIPDEWFIKKATVTGQETFFPEALIRERVELIRRVTSGIENVEVDCSDELLADYAKKKGSCVIVKGLRAGSDFEYEFQMALINRKINPDLDTMFLTAEHQYTYLSSSTVKELGAYGVDLSDFLPEQIIPDFKKRIHEIRQGGNRE